MKTYFLGTYFGYPLYITIPGTISQRDIDRIIRQFQITLEKGFVTLNEIE